MAREHNTTVDALALRFCIDTISPFTVLSGVSQEEHLLSNLKANKLSINEEDWEYLKAFKVTPEHYWAERKLLTWN